MTDRDIVIAAILGDKGPLEDKLFGNLIESIPQNGGLVIAPGETPDKGVPVTAADPSEGFTLEELYKAIDTDIVQVIDCGHPRLEGYVLVVDEEGRFRNEVAPNKFASGFYTGNFSEADADAVVGKALLTKRENLK